MTEKVAVIGAGTMGSGIAHVAAGAGLSVNLVDTDTERVNRGVRSIRLLLEKRVTKGKLSGVQCEEICSRLTGMTDMVKAVAGAVMVVEAVFENLELKKNIFRKLDSLCPPDVILASNTSTLSIASLSEAVNHPNRVIGTHYFSPVPVMKLVEIVRGRNTDEATVLRTIELCRRFGKIPVVAKDIPGFIVNRFLCLLYNESANMIYNGSANAEEIDQAVKLGCNWPMGINEIMDLAGVDVCAFAIEAMYQMTGEERYKPSPLFKKMLSEKKLGRKSGMGFYQYEAK